MARKDFTKRFSPAGSEGFTLVEMCVVMFLVAIILAIATPTYVRTIASFERESALNAVIYDLRRARAEALAQGARGVFSVAAASDMYSFGLDPLPVNSPAAMDSESFRRKMPRSITLAGAPAAIFDSRGYAITETGALTTVNFNLQYRGNTYCTVTVRSTGNVSKAC